MDDNLFETDEVFEVAFSRVPQARAYYTHTRVHFYKNAAIPMQTATHYYNPATTTADEVYEVSLARFPQANL